MLYRGYTFLVKNAVTWIYVFSNRNGEQIVGTFYGKELKKKSISKRS